MKPKLLIAAVVAAFALPAYGAGDKAKSEASATSGANQGASGASSTSGASGAEAMFEAMDKNKDGSVTREEAKGTPHAKDFTTLDKDNNGKRSGEEHAGAPEDAGD